MDSLVQDPVGPNYRHKALALGRYPRARGPGDYSAAAGIDVNQALDSGAVHVYRRSATVWQREAYIKASNSQAYDQFGASLALEGDILAVGAPGEDSAATGIDGDQADDSAPYSGAVYVFRRSGTVWRQEAYVKASNSRMHDDFGHSVALRDGNLAVVSDGRRFDHPGQGAVYMFRRGDAGWQEQSPVTASTPKQGGRFGDVALSSDTIVVGAPYDDVALWSDDQSGAVYVFQCVQD